MMEVAQIKTQLIEENRLKQQILDRTIQIKEETHNLKDAEEMVKAKIEAINDEVDELREKRFFEEKNLKEDEDALNNLIDLATELQNKMNVLETNTATADNALKDFEVTGQSHFYSDKSVSPQSEALKQTWEGTTTTKKSDAEMIFDWKQILDEKGITPLSNGTAFVPETGLYQLHAGETVLNKHESQSQMGGTNMTFVEGSIQIDAGQRDAESLFDEIEQVARRRISSGVRI